MPGVFLVSGQISTGRAIDDLHLLIQCRLSDEEYEGRVVYVPLR